MKLKIFPLLIIPSNKLLCTLMLIYHYFIKNLINLILFLNIITIEGS